ncbi:30S ribosomal protein S20 [Buchnera aphidicola]|uniref:Small ribosomal subunit protein bS20 n=1 Tax=Buchnera aphidicola (Therioaphis trifolii) TaxID=1241884 RepID=A0A4D6YDK0_9GAMM|nr:30S ribosomal protein S20 [Buchnera aphidicola]QCI27112.1 30S ribosomal protein S20 [Buchnera aphidicola (Therioaphis trifolii)]
MSNIKSSKKYAIKSQKLKKINSSRRTILRRLMKKISIAINEKNKILVKNIWLKLQSNLDKFAQKGLIHKNTAARYKSKFYLKIKNLD